MPNYVLRADPDVRRPTAGMRIARKLIAAARSYTHTGNAATLTYDASASWTEVRAWTALTTGLTAPTGFSIDENYLGTSLVLASDGGTNNVIRVMHRAGLTGGSAPASIGITLPSSYRTIRMDMHGVKFSDSGTVPFALNFAGLNKVFLLDIGGGYRYVPQFRVQSGLLYDARFVLGGGNQGTISDQTNYGTSLAEGELIRGTRYDKLSWIWTGNTSGNHDGSIGFAINDVMLTPINLVEGVGDDPTAIQWTAGDSTCGYTSNSSVWGGGGGTIGQAGTTPLPPDPTSDDYPLPADFWYQWEKVSVSIPS